MKKIAVLFLTLSLLWNICTLAYAAPESTWDGSVASSFHGGQGSAEDPYQISTGAELAYLVSGIQYSDNHYILTNDIRLNPESAFTKDENGIINGAVNAKSWSSSRFSGHLDGCGYTVYGLYCDGTSGTSLVGDIWRNSSLENLNLGYGYVCAQNAAGLADSAGTDALIDNCTNYATVAGNYEVAGVLGTNSGAVVSNCTNYGKVTGVQGVEQGKSGGIVSLNYTDGVILNCTNYGDVYGYTSAAGIAATNYHFIARCENFGNIYGIRGYAGGITGNISQGIITSCTNSGKVKGGIGSDGYYGADVGGIAGTISAGTVENCLNIGTVETPLSRNGGGLVGYLYSDVRLCNSVSVGAYEESVREIYGYKYSAAQIIDCYYASDVTGEASCGTGFPLTMINSNDFAARLNTYVEASPTPYIRYWMVKNGILGFAAPEDVLTITASAEEGGLISPNGTVEVLSHYGATFTITPDYGYVIADVLVDGMSVGAVSEYTFRDVTAPQTIQAVFAENGLIAKIYAGGSGTEKDPYQIENAAQLRLLAKEVLEGNDHYSHHFVLTDDILLNDANCFLYDEDGHVTGPHSEKMPENWTPIGSSASRFDGIFDGQGHSISGLYLDREDDSIGLFGYAQGGLISNITLTYGYVRGTDDVGGVAGHANNLINCTNQNTTVSGTLYVGGVGGWPGTTIDCINYATVTGTDWVGGITGAGNVQRCTNYGAVTVSHYFAGGIVGGNCQHLAECMNYGAVSGPNAGGIVGECSASDMISCMNFGIISGNSSGGLTGRLDNSIHIINCISLGAVPDGYADHGELLYSSTVIRYEDTYYVSDKVGTFPRTEMEELTFAQLNSNLLVSRFNQRIAALDGEYSYWELDSELGYPVLSERDRLCQVTVKTLGGGTVFPTSRFALVEGSSFQIRFLPDAGNSVLRVLVNGSSVEATGTYSILSLEKDVLIEVVFADSNGMAITGFAKGSGIKQDPFVVSSADELRHMANIVNRELHDYVDYYFVLANDLVLNNEAMFKKTESGIISSAGSAVAFDPIGTGLLAFNGIFDGNGHSISGLYVNTQIPYTGLFSKIGPSGAVRNLQIGYGYVVTSDNYAGAIAGCNEGSIENCTNTACVLSAQNGVGGIAGYHLGTIVDCKNYANLDSSAKTAGIASWSEGKISKCSNLGNITGSYASGISNDMRGGTIEFCGNRGNMTATNYYGSATGVCGTSRANDAFDTPDERSGWITDCQNYGELQSGHGGYAAGIILDGYDVRVSKCINYGRISGLEGAGIAVTIFESYDSLAWCEDCVNFGDIFGKSYAAGIVCSAYADCYNSVNHGTVTGGSFFGVGSDTVGGVVAMQSSDAYVYNCGNTGVVTGTSAAGGVIGKMGAGVFNCYNTGTVTGEKYVGGLAGRFENRGTSLLYNCYSSGNVVCEDTVTSGALVGLTDAVCIISNCWYNSDLCSKSIVGTLNGYIENCGRKTAEELASEAFVAELNLGNYKGFAFKQWYIDHTVNLPVLGELKSSTFDMPVIATVLQSCQNGSLVLSVSIFGEKVDASYVAEYNEDGKMVAIHSVDLNSMSSDILINPKNTWKVFVLNNSVPVIPDLHM